MSLDPMTRCEPSILFFCGGGSKLFGMTEFGSHVGVS